MAIIQVSHAARLDEAGAPIRKCWLRNEVASLCSRRLTKRQTKRVTDEAVAVLSGRARHFRNDPDVDLAWVHLNQLAHADCRTLRRLSNRAILCEDWNGVAATIAGEMLALTDGQANHMLRLQRECLIPFELELLTSGDAATRWGPGLLLRSCRARLA